MSRPAGRVGTERLSAWGMVRFVRVRDWLHFLPLPLLSSGPPPLAPTHLAASLVAAAGCLAFAYGWNEWEDEGLSRWRADGTTPWGAAPATLKGLLTAIAAVTVAAAAHNGLGPAVAAVVSLVGGWMYSAGPRLKCLPVIGTLTNAWIFTPIAFLGASGGSLDREAWLMVWGFVGVLLQNQIVHEAAHAADDRIEGVRTTWLQFGPRVSALGILGFGVLAVTALSLAAPSVLVGVAAAPFVGVTLLASNPRNLTAPARASALRRWQRMTGLLIGAAAWLVWFGLLA